MVASALGGVVAQRLVRTICPDCAVEHPATERELGFLGDHGRPGLVLRCGAGCSFCRGTGYRGRTGVFEILKITEPIIEALVRGASAGEIRARALAEVMTTSSRARRRGPRRAFDRRGGEAGARSGGGGMTLYAYAGRDLAGQELQGVHEAADERSLRDALRRRGVLLVQARIAKAARSRPLRVRPDELARMTLQLASMLEAGLPLGCRLQIFELQAESEAMRGSCADRRRRRGGHAASTSLAKHPQIFSEFYIGLVGRERGTLASVPAGWPVS
jgi:hypothetical protein